MTDVLRAHKAGDAYYIPPPEHNFVLGSMFVNLKYFRIACVLVTFNVYINKKKCHLL